MSDFKPGSLSEQVEALIDQHSLLDVLVAIECACGDKAEHIRHNWQDRKLARLWDSASKAVGRAIRHPSIERLP